MPPKQLGSPYLKAYIQKAEVPKWRCDAQDEFEFEVRSDTVDAGGRKEKGKKDETPVEAVRRWRWWNQHNSVDYQTAGDAESDKARQHHPHYLRHLLYQI